LRCDIYLERFHIDSLIDDKLEEELIDTLEMRPGRVHFILLLYTSLREA
jgi:hypothetical protein